MTIMRCRQIESVITWLKVRQFCWSFNFLATISSSKEGFWWQFCKVASGGASPTKLNVDLRGEWQMRETNVAPTSAELFNVIIDWNWTTQWKSLAEAIISFQKWKIQHINRYRFAQSIFVNKHVWLNKNRVCNLHHFTHVDQQKSIKSVNINNLKIQLQSSLQLFKPRSIKEGIIQ